MDNIPGLGEMGAGSSTKKKPFSNLDLAKPAQVVGAMLRKGADCDGRQPTRMAFQVQRSYGDVE
eukprot:755381-Hanusia_phi.AAC.5